MLLLAVEVNGKMCYPSQCNNMVCRGAKPSHGSVCPHHSAVCRYQFIFPGVGLGATFIGAQRITDRMFYRAAKALAKCVTEEELAQGKVFPSVSNIRDVSLEVAVAGQSLLLRTLCTTWRTRFTPVTLCRACHTPVCKSALHDGLTSMAPPADLHEYLRSQMYVPEYRPLVVEE